MMSKAALDTNVLIYLQNTSSLSKQEIAENLLANKPTISSQVISEYLNVTRRLLDLSKDELLAQAADLFSGCHIFSVVPDTLRYASDLVKQYNFQIFDAVIIASAIQSQCDVLYSEDMHNGLLVEKKLTILNPFI
jgi:predicted nucleic acid-binding protein